ncbi:aldo/keto reductase [Rugamonas sp.]|uniref:aldo/keto reductase n=1 Tax=Rugamonas sp. TaxID=1926287 RepID=UPI0025DF1CB6|nr:aldo/keto reductase [Rugamonas sp.]
MASPLGPKYKLNNGIDMPAVGLGVFHSEPEETVAAVSSAIAAGYRLIDTAAAYMNEQQVGEGIRAAGIARDEVFVTTKVWMSDYGPEQTPRAFELSLRKLGLDFLDLYLIHWPVPSAFDATVAAYQAAIKLLADGRVRAIGVCNFDASDLDKLIQRTGHIPAVNQVELHPFFNQRALREADDSHGIITQAWSPIGGIKRYGEKAKASKEVQDPLSHPTVALLAKKYRKTPAQIILRWQIELGTSPIPKSVRPARIAENIDIFDFALTPGEVLAIDALDTGRRGGPDPQLVTVQSFAITAPQT